MGMFPKVSAAQHAVVLLIMGVLFVWTSFHLVSKISQEDREVLLTSTISSEASDAAATFPSSPSAFGSSLLSTLMSSASDKKNIAMSALSVAYALEMAVLGARGQTEKELLEALGIKHHTQHEAALQQLRDVHEYISNLQVSEALECSMANRLYVQDFIEADDATFDTYRSLCSQRFGADTKAVDFWRNSEEVTKQINEYVKDETHGMIPRLLDNVPPSTRLILLNVLYFKGLWEKAFNKMDTKKNYNFHVSSKQKTAIDMMFLHTTPRLLHSKSSIDMGFGHEGALEFVRVPYQGGNWNMWFLKPTTSLKEIVQAIDDAGGEESYLKYLEGNERTVTDKLVSLGIPKVNLNARMELSETLKKLGVQQAFQNNADFSGITEANDLSISKIIHQVVMEIDESGTRAAAGTAIVFGATAMPIMPRKSIVMDSPYLAMLTHTDETGRHTVLFHAAVNDPSKQ